MSLRLVTDDRLPTLTEDQVKAVLDRSRKLITDAGGPNISFEPPMKRSAAEQLQEFVGLITPVPLPSPEALQDAQGANPIQLQGRVEEICRAYGGVSEIKALLDPEAAARLRNYEALSVHLSTQYIERVKGLLSLKTSDGKNVIDGDTGLLFRLSTWGLCQGLAPSDTPVRLTLYNGFLMEDLPRGAAPHSLATAQAFGLSAVPRRTAVVAYHLIWRDDLPAVPHRLGKLTEDQKLDAIAYVVAHEVGIHLLLDLADDFASTAGIARPLASLAKPEDLRPPATAPRFPTARRLPLEHLKLYDLKDRVPIASARGEKEVLLDLLHRAIDLDLPGEDKDPVIRMITQAISELRKK